MIRVKGDANIRGKIAYVPQQAWMQNATLKNNILFGTEYKQELYEKVGGLMHIYSRVHVLRYYIIVHLEMFRAFTYIYRVFLKFSYT